MKKETKIGFIVLGLLSSVLAYTLIDIKETKTVDFKTDKEKIAIHLKKEVNEVIFTNFNYDETKAIKGCFNRENGDKCIYLKDGEFINEIDFLKQELTYKAKVLNRTVALKETDCDKNMNLFFEDEKYFDVNKDYRYTCDTNNKSVVFNKKGQLISEIEKEKEIEESNLRKKKYDFEDIKKMYFKKFKKDTYFEYKSYSKIEYISKVNYKEYFEQLVLKYKDINYIEDVKDYDFDKYKLNDFESFEKYLESKKIYDTYKYKRIFAEHQKNVRIDYIVSLYKKLGRN